MKIIDKKDDWYQLPREATLTINVFQLTVILEKSWMVHPVHLVTTETTSLTVVLGLVKSVRKKRHSAQMIDRAAKVSTTMSLINAGAQWLSGRVLDSRPRGRGSSLTSVTALWSLSKTHLS